MNDEPINEYTSEQQRLLSVLPRRDELAPGIEDELAAALRAEGFFHRRRRTWPLQACVALLLLLLGAYLGARLGQRNSLEALLEREGLQPQQRVLLLQRAGSAYVRAAQAYASATARADSTASEVASQVLIGAAQALARNGLDRGLSVQLTNLLQPISSPRVLWF